MRQVKTEQVSNEVSDFVLNVAMAYKKQFPKSLCKITVGSGVFSQYIIMTFGLQPEGTQSHGITENDPMHHRITIDLKYNVSENKYYFYEGTSELNMIIGNRLYLNPSKGSIYAMEPVKIGWRKKIGTPDALLTHLTNYFDKMKKTVEANRLNIHGGHNGAL